MRCRWIHFCLILLIIIIGAELNTSASAQTPQIATFQEIARLIIDKQISNTSTVSITLQTSSNQEFKISDTLENKILQTREISSVIITNEDNCIIGVQDSVCILVNVKLNTTGIGINAIQKVTREIGDSVINDINDILNTRANFHSVFIHTDDTQLVNTGAKNIRHVSAVYTEPYKATDFIFDGIASTIIVKEITRGGGFYDTAKYISTFDDTTFSLSMIPQKDKILYQIHVSLSRIDESGNVISPLKHFGIDTLYRSDYFSQGFYPLNSLLQVIISSNDIVGVDVKSKIETILQDGSILPADITKSGWVFELKNDLVDGRYIFGDTVQAGEKEVEIILQTENAEITKINTFDSFVIIIIGIVAILIVLFYLRGYKRKD